MSRVLFLVNHDVVIYNFRLELVERLLADGHEVHISSPYGERIDDLILLGCYYHQINISRHGINPAEELKLILCYKKLLKDIKPDIVFTYTIKPNVYGGIACSLANIHFVANITGLGTAVENGGAVQKITLLLYKIAFRKVQKVFFQNADNMQFFAKNKIAVGKQLLPGSGVNLNRFQILKYPSDQAVEFAFISRIMKEKGIDQYLEAAEYIRKKYPNTKFHICGFCEQNYEEILGKLVDKDVIVYHGMMRDIRTILEQVHCVIHPTYYPEGLSNVLLESLACARPIITTNRSGCKEVIDEGINGLICEQRNSKDLIRQIERFMALSWETRKQMGLAGRAKVEQQYDRQIIVEKYIGELNH